MSQSENIVRQCQGKEDDLNSAIAAKDSQLAVLRVRLQEVDQELKTKTASIAGLQDERNQYVLVDLILWAFSKRVVQRQLR